MKRLISLGIMVGLLFSGNCFAQLDRSGDIAELVAGIESSSRVQRVNAAKKITRSGITDQQLYEKVAEIIQAGYQLPYEKDHADELAWMCKALAASGDEKYRSLLNEVATNASSVKVKRYAEQSSELIEQYAQRSLILNETDSWDEELTAEENRLLNMLKSDDVGLRRDAAKTVVRRVQVNPKVMAEVAATLERMSAEIQEDNLYIDTMAWLCKALAASGESSYLPQLETLKATSSNSKLRKYAGRAIDALN